MPAIKSTLSAIKDCLLRERTLGRRPASPARRKRNRQRGVALVAVMIAIAIVLVFTGEFGTSTTVDLVAAANYRDQMRAHFLARSAINLSELVIRIQQRLDNTQIGGTRLSDMGIRITDFADQVLLAFCGNPEEVQSMIGFSSSDVKGLGVDIGTCGIINRTITTDDDKINLNCAAGGKGPEDTLQFTLSSLVYFPAYDPVFQEADAEGYRRDRPTQVAALLDYVDLDSVHVHDIGTTEDYGYESLRDKYKPKNNYLDTIGEIRLIRGVDDRFWTLFGPAFTVYGGCKVNLSAATNPQLIAAILLLAPKNINDPILQDPIKLFALAGLVAQAKQFGEQFNKLQDFVDFVKDPQASLTMVASKGGMAGSAAQQSQANGSFAALTGGQKLGLELDAGKLGQIAATGPRRTYRVEAFGEIERKQKSADGSPVFPAIRATVTGVWDTKVVPQNVRKPPVPKGAWVFLRED
jgi:general secretion pathway protein K